MRSLAPLATVQPVDRPEYGTLRELPTDFPLELRYFAQSAMSTQTTPYAQLEALADVLSSAPYEEEDDSIDNALDVASLTDLVLTSKKGTQAQFATAFALMARSQGFPTRMVVGFSTRGKADTRKVKSTDVLVYPEVELTKVGWVPFAPGPRDLARGVPVVQRFKPPKEPKPPKEEPSPTPTPEPTPTPSPSPEPEQSQSRSLVGLLIPVGVIAALLAWPLLVAWRRGRVRQRYRRGAADEQVEGAWHYVRASRSRLGQPLADTSSPAGYAADPQTERGLASLAATAETAMYAPETLSDSDADQAWTLADGVVAAAVKHASFSRRLRWWLVPQRR